MEELGVLKYCLGAAKRAYEQENVRQRNAMDKAEYLFKYLTLLTTVFNVAVSVISKMNQVNTADFYFIALYVPMLTAGFIGIASTLLIQMPRKIKQFSLGTEELKKVQKEPARFRTEKEWTYQEILWMDTITTRMRANNDKAMKWILIAYISLAVMILCFGIFITYLILLV